MLFRFLFNAQPDAVPKVSHSAVVGAGLGWSVGCCLTGWGLSLLHQLNPLGVVVALGSVVALTLGGWLLGRQHRASGGYIRWSRFRRNPWAAAFLALWLVAALGGWLHEPNNFDALAYRFPRLFHWVAAGGWHWIDTADARLNYSAPASEWLLLPGWALTRSVRLAVITNLAAFALLPGLLFSVWRRLGIRGRVARRWMWLFPSGYGYLLQAASAGNDLLGTVFFLAALDLALRGRARPRWNGTSAVAMALATAVKLSNVPLMLPWAVAWWPGRHQRARAVTVLALGIALAVSGLPTLIANRLNTGDFAGDPTNADGLKPTSIPAALAGNALAACVQNVVPPVWPAAGAWNAWTESYVLPHLAAIRDHLPRFTLRTAELAQEEWAGMGLPLLLLLGLALTGRLRTPPDRLSAWQRAVPCAAMLAALGYAATIGSEMPARLLLPYYPLLVAPLLRMSGGRREPPVWLWRGATTIVFALAAVVLVLNPARPLWPWQTVFDFPAVREHAPALAARAHRVYAVYASRTDYLAPLRQAWPAGESRVGFAAGHADSEVSLWRPFGQVEVVTSTRLGRLTPETGRVRYLVVRMDAVAPELVEDLDRARARGRIAVILRQSLSPRASSGAEDWAVWQWQPANAPAP